MIKIMESPYLILKDPTDGYECRINVGDSMYVRLGGEYQKIIFFNTYHKYSNMLKCYHYYIIGFIPDNPDRVIEVPLEDIGLDKGDFIRDSDGLEYCTKYSYVALDNQGCTLRNGDKCKIGIFIGNDTNSNHEYDMEYINGTISSIDIDQVFLKTTNGITIKIHKDTNRYFLFKCDLI